MNKFIKGMLNLEIHVSEHCNLNCKGCFHFSPLAEPAFLDICQYEKDISRLSELFYGEAEYINLMGGEPLLNPDIVHIIQITRKYFKYSKIRIVTNGTRLKDMDDEFWQECSRSDVSVEPTKYPIDIDLILPEKKAKEFGVEYHIYHTATTMCRQPIALNGEYDCNENFEKCPQANNWIQLKNGKLFTCITAAHIPNLIREFGLRINVSEKNYIDIYKVKNGDEILEKLAQPIPLCRFCNLSGSIKNIPYASTTRSRYEWIDFEFKRDDFALIKDKPVFVFGAGYYGKKTISRLEVNDIPVKCILVSSQEGNPGIIGCTLVRTLDSVNEEEKDNPVLIAVSEESRQSVYDILVEYGFTKIIFVTWPH